MGFAVAPQRHLSLKAMDSGFGFVSPGWIPGLHLASTKPLKMTTHLEVGDTLRVSHVG